MNNVSSAKWELDKFVSEAIVIAFFSAWAYLITFFYEAGYLAHFGLPPKLIVIEISSVLIALIALIGFLISLFFIGYYVLGTENATSEIGNEIRAISFCFFFTILIPILLFGINKNTYVYLGGFAMFLCLRAISIFLSKGKTIEEKLKYQEGKRDRDGPLYWLSDRLGRKWLIKIFFFIFTLILASGIGGSKAVKQDDHFIIQGEPELVIVTMYGDRIIAMPFDEASHLVDRKFYLLNAEYLAKEGRAIYMKKLGRLNLKPN